MSHVMRVTSLLFLFFWNAQMLVGQQVTLAPASPTSEDQVAITVNFTGTPLAGETNIYMHAGVVTTNTTTPSGSDWRFVKGNWGQDDGVGKMTAVAGQANTWTIQLSPTLRSYFGVPSGTNIFYLAMVFRNANGSKQTTPDIFRPLQVGAFVTLVAPTSDVFTVTGESVSIIGSSSQTATAIELLVDIGTGYVSLGADANTSLITRFFSPTQSKQVSIKVRATISGNVVESITAVNIFVRAGTATQSLPVGIKDGINYNAADPTRATLVLLAPNKSFCYLVGDFNNWAISDAYLMKQTPDGKRFWFELAGLTPGVEYVFQYWVDGTIKVGDPLADKVSDPFNDRFILPDVYPNIPVNTRTGNGIATVLQTNQTPYSWAASEATWVAPDKKELVVYELLVRDFIKSHSYNDLADTLNYFKRLGVNAIELMPIMEFEGNISWGYNPSYFLAPDKYYGTKNALKKFIEKAHQNGIAVILDMVLNHAFGSNPMVRMYFDNVAGKPLPTSPWFNVDATHPFNVGYDFNHESPYTKAFVDTVCSYWLKEYHFDGFRFDLSKGFTQTKNPTDVGAWGNYDQSRIDILKRMANKIWSVKPNAYVILEHFAAVAEENVLADAGMMLWGNLTGIYDDLLEANGTPDLDLANRFSHVNYMESHDEERLMVNLKNSGKTVPGYNIKDQKISLNRVKLGAAFFYTIPGPKMLWQFGELGYDKSINYCEDGSISGSCRTNPKPLPWGPGSLGYYANADNQNVYKTIAAINRLIATNKAVFKSGSVNLNSSGAFKTINITHPSMNVVIAGNFSTDYRLVPRIFSRTGQWFDYFGNTSIAVTDVNSAIMFAPGEFRIFTTLQQPSPGANLVDFLVTEATSADTPVQIYPNPSVSGKVDVYATDITKVRLHVVDGLGKSIKQPDSTLWVNENRLEVFLPAGFYVFKIETGDGKVYSKKVIMN